MECSSSDGSFLRTIWVSGQTIRHFVDQRLKAYDLTIEQLQILKNLEPGKGISQSQLCGLVEKNPANLTRLIDRLEKKGWIVRGPHPGDRRALLVQITDEGFALKNELMSGAGRVNGQLTAGIDPRKLEIASDVLQQIKENIERLSENN